MPLPKLKNIFKRRRPSDYCRLVHDEEEDEPEVIFVKRCKTSDPSLPVSDTPNQQQHSDSVGPSPPLLSLHREVISFPTLEKGQIFEKLTLELTEKDVLYLNLIIDNASVEHDMRSTQSQLNALTKVYERNQIEISRMKAEIDLLRDRLTFHMRSMNW